MHRKEAASATLSNPLPSSPLSPLPPSLSLLCCAAGEEGSFLLLSRLLQKEFPSPPPFPLPWHAPPLKRRRRRRRTAFPLRPRVSPFFCIPPRLSSSHQPRVIRLESGGRRMEHLFFSRTTDVLCGRCIVDSIPQSCIWKIPQQQEKQAGVKSPSPPLGRPSQVVVVFYVPLNILLLHEKGAAVISLRGKGICTAAEVWLSPKAS